MPDLLVLLYSATFDASDDGRGLSSFAVEVVPTLGRSLSAWATATTSYGPTSQRLGLSVC